MHNRDAICLAFHSELGLALLMPAASFAIKHIALNRPARLAFSSTQHEHKPANAHSRLTTGDVQELDVQELIMISLLPQPARAYALHSGSTC